MSELKTAQICKICQKAQATQTGSHMLSAFMMDGMLGIAGAEKGYLLSSNPASNYKLNVGASPIKMDFQFCRGCEQRLSYLEGYISQEFLRKVEGISFAQNFPIIKATDDYVLHRCNNVNIGAFFLLIASLVWRISIGNTEFLSPFKLKDIEEEYLRRMINEMLPLYQDFKVKPDRKIWLQNTQETILNFNDFKFITITYTPKEADTANAVFFSDILRHPYSLMMNEFIILAFFGDVALPNIEDDYFLLGSLLNENTCVNKCDSKIIIAKLQRNRYRGIIKRFHAIVLERRLVN